MTDYTKNPMHCPRDPSIECLKCPFETCVYDEPEEGQKPQEYQFAKQVRVLSDKEKERNRRTSKEYYWAHREELLKKRNTPEFKAYTREYHKKLYSDPEKLKERRRKNLEYYYRNREAILEKGRIERMKRNEENHNE